MTIAIAYNSGSYGTYLEWCLTVLTRNSSMSAPFTSVGNSHNFLGNQVMDITKWDNFVATRPNETFARVHPKNAKEQSLSKNLDHVCLSADSLIYVYPDREYVLLGINNYITKVWKNWWEHRLTKDSLFDKIYQNWPVKEGTPANDIPIWIRREFLSFYLIPAWFDQVEWYHLDKWNHHKACIVTTKDLLFDFESTLYRIQKHTNLDFVQPVSNLFAIHAQNLSLQKNLTQDQLCNSIIDSIFVNSSFDWEPLPLGSEVWLQWELRNRGFELKCDGLDIFPTNNIKLRELLYPV